MTKALDLKKGEIFTYDGDMYTVITPESDLGVVVADKYMHKFNGRWKFNKSKERKKLPSIIEVQRVRIKLENY